MPRKVHSPSRNHAQRHALNRKQQRELKERKRQRRDYAQINRELQREFLTTLSVVKLHERARKMGVSMASKPHKDDMIERLAT